MSLLSWAGVQPWDLAEMILCDQFHQSTATNTENNLASKLPGLYFPAFLGPEQQSTGCLLDF